MSATAATAPMPIKARRPRFDLSATPNEWISGDLAATHTIDSLHVALPPGERWFCDVFRDALPLITDEQLREDVKGFIGQEATHARAHDLGLEHLAQHGIDLRAEVAWVDRTRERMRKRIARLPGPLRRAALRAQLAAIATIEHYTAVLGMWIVEADLAEADPAMIDLLRWHGAEEVEHRSVAFDLYQHLDGGYLRRAAHGVFASVAILGGLMLVAMRIMALDPEANGTISPRRYGAAVRAGHLPRLGKVALSLREYLKRSYHPSHYGSEELARAYLAASPGVLAGTRATA